MLSKGPEKLTFHGYDFLESINKIFSEHFLDRENDYFNACFDYLLEITDTEQLYSGIGKVGHILDEYKLGGSKIIRAACLARFQKVSEIEIEQEINEAIEKFDEIRNIQDKLELIEENKIKWILKNQYFLATITYCCWHILKAGELKIN